MKHNDTCHARRSEIVKSLQRDIMALLRWDEEKYAQFVYSQGLAYLEAYLDGDPYGVSIFENSRVFWAWWRNHWANRDSTFLSYRAHFPAWPSPVPEGIYIEMHNGAGLAMTIHPNGRALEDEYAQMASEAIDEKRQQVWGQ